MFPRKRLPGVEDDCSTHLDEVLGRDPVELEVPGEAVHAAAELDLGVHLVREGPAPHARVRPLQHRLEPSRKRQSSTIIPESPIPWQTK